MFFLNADHCILAPVAQWIERRPPEPKARGSNPPGRARMKFHTPIFWGSISKVGKLY